MRLGAGVAAAIAVTALGVSPAQADDHRGHNRQSIDTKADYTPFERFTPLAASAPCPGEGSGRQAEPFLLPGAGEDGPAAYEQAVFFEESDPITPQPPQGPGSKAEDKFDMNTQNEFGKDAGRYVYRTHEVGGAANEAAPDSPNGGMVTVTDLMTGVTKNLAQRNDWEAFDGIVWTPWGTLLAAEERVTQTFRDPSVPQASGGLLYELFLDEDDPSRLDPSRERITPGDGTSDTVQDGIRARPAVGAKSHEGIRFDKRGFLYGIAESSGETQADPLAPVASGGVSGGIFRFVPDRKGDLSSGQLAAYDSPNGKDGEGRWQPLDRAAVQVDADRHAAAAGVNRYQRPEDVETGESTGVDRLNGGHTLYVAITSDGADPSSEEGVFNIDLSQPDRPFGYRYVNNEQTGTLAHPQPANAPAEPDFNGMDNVALDGVGNLAITEDNGGSPPTKTAGDDIFIAAPPRGEAEGGGADGERGAKHAPARTVQKFASMKDCIAEGSGVYFALAGTERFARRNPDPQVRALVDGETLFANRQHAGQTSAVDQAVAIAPVRDDG